MKKIVLLLLISFPIFSYSQNVGIGTTAPLEKLEVKNALRSTVRISSNSFNDTTELLLSNRNSGNSGTDFSLKSVREQGLIISSLSDIVGNNSSNSLVIQPSGNVGIGLMPAYRFHVSGQSRFNGLTQIEGLNLLEFGAGIAVKEINAGKIGYNAFGQNALTFVGAGTNATNRAVYFFAEGGTTFSGPATISGNANIGGQLQINGNPGTTGQVLTSNGASDPLWKNTALSNMTRFSVNINHPLSTGHSLAALSTAYNLSPADVSVGANTFTINKTGLYHFDIYLQTTLSALSGTTMYFNYYFSPSATVYPDLLQDETTLVGGTGIGRLNHRFSVDMHITAPATIGLGGYHVLGSGGIVAGKLYCHLISE